MYFLNARYTILFLHLLLLLLLLLLVAVVVIIQYTRLGLNPEAWRVLREVFLVILLAEWGDKSMFTTISLATAQDPWGVFVGKNAFLYAGVFL